MLRSSTSPMLSSSTSFICLSPEVVYRNARISFIMSTLRSSTSPIARRTWYQWRPPSSVYWAASRAAHVVAITVRQGSGALYLSCERPRAAHGNDALKQMCKRCVGGVAYRPCATSAPEFLQRPQHVVEHPLLVLDVGSSRLLLHIVRALRRWRRTTGVVQCSRHPDHASCHSPHWRRPTRRRGERMRRRRMHCPRRCAGARQHLLCHPAQLVRIRGCNGICGARNLLHQCNSP